MGLLLMASRGHAELSSKPTAFDFQERTGFPLTSDERIVPETNLDVYWIGQSSPQGGGQPSPVFVSFDVAHAIPSSPGDLLFQLLRDTSTYQRDAFACNGLGVNSPLGGQLDLCKLSNLEPSSVGRAYVEGLSLIGDLDIEIPVASLGGRAPTKLFADVRYTHAINY